MLTIKMNGKTERFTVHFYRSFLPFIFIVKSFTKSLLIKAELERKKMKTSFTLYWYSWLCFSFSENIFMPLFQLAWHEKKSSDKIKG